MLRKAEKLYHNYSNDYYKINIRIANQVKCNLVTVDECNIYRTKSKDCMNDSYILYDFLKGLLD